MSYIPLLSSIAALISALILFKGYMRFRGLGLLVGGLSMSLFALGAFLEFYSAYIGYWPDTVYRLYYATSPIQPALLALTALAIYGYGGWRNNIIKIYSAYIVLISIILIFLSFTADINQNLLNNPYVGGAAMPNIVRMFSPPLTIPSGLIILIFPLYTYLKIQRSLDRLTIPAASLIVMIGGAMIRRGLIQMFYIFEFIGSLVLLFSFYLIYRGLVSEGSP